MRLTESLPFPPCRDAIHPSRKEGTGLFIDTGVDLPELDPRIYLHLETVRELAKEFLGMVDSGDIALVRVAIEESEQEITRLQEELQEADQALQAIEFIKHKEPVNGRS